MSLCWVCVTDQHGPQQPTLCAPSFAQPMTASSKHLTDSFVEPSSLAACRHIPLSAASITAAANLDMKLDWNLLPGSAAALTPFTLQLSAKPDTSKHFHIFVGDLCPYLQPQQLRDAFATYGLISDCKIIQDTQTMRSKGYGFVTFVKKEDAANAIKQMNGRQLGTRVIRTNWAIRKLSAGINGKPITVDEVIRQTSNNNCTVYCGGIMTGLTEEVIRKTFSSYGSIEDIKIFEEKGYAFIRFTTKEAAAEAIVGQHLTEINGHVVKCSWGKKGDDTPNDVLNTPSSPSLALNRTYSQLLPSPIQLTSDFSHLVPSNCQFKDSTARLPLASPINYLVYDTHVPDNRAAQFQRLNDCGTNIGQQPVSSDYRSTFGISQMAALTTPCNPLQQPTIAHVLPPGVVLAQQTQPQIAAPPNVIYTLHPVI